MHWKIVLGVLAFGMFGWVANASAAYTASVQNGTLKIVGDAASDKLALRLAPGSPSTLQVDVGDDGTADFAFDRSTFTAIDVAAGGGDDQVRVDQVDGPLTGDVITLNGGAGNDTLIGGDGSETLIGGTGNDTVDGNRGNDTVLLGGGDDTFTWDPGDASDTVDGQGGHDTLAFNGSNAAEHFDISANGARVRFFRDVAAVTMDLGGIDTIALRTIGSADTVDVGDLSATATKTVAVDLAPDGAADTVNLAATSGDDQLKVANTADGALTVNGLPTRTVVSGGDPEDNVNVQGLGGNDTLVAPVDVTGTAHVTFDGGDGTDTSRFQGTAGGDTIGIAANGPAERAFTATGVALDTLPSVESLVVSGGDGNDTVTGQNGIAAMTPLTILGGTGDDILRGGDGNDVIQGGLGNDVIDGNRGNDTSLFGGAGDDTFVWDPGDGSDTVEGQSGTNTLAFNGSNAAEKIELAANGPRLRLTRDVGAVTIDADGIDTVALRTLGSADTVNVGDLTATATKTVTVDLAPDGAADTVNLAATSGNDQLKVANAADGSLTVNGLPTRTLVSGGDPGLDNVVVQGLAGDDTLTAPVEVTGAAHVTFDGGDGTDTSRFQGTSGDDTIGIAADGPAELAFTATGVALDTLPSVESLVVSGGDGNDTVTGQNGIAAMTPLTILGGTGDDILRGGDGNDVFQGGLGNDVIDGNRGSDTALLGAGDDTFQWDPGDGSDTVEGQDGNDTLAFNGSNAGEKIELAANGPRLRLTRDVGAVTMDTDGIEAVDVRALGSADTITVDDLSGTDVHSVSVDLGGADGAIDNVIANGSAGPDNVQVTGSGSEVDVTGLAAALSIAGSEPTDTLAVNTLGGKDTVAVAPDVSTLLTPIVDLGADQ